MRAIANFLRTYTPNSAYLVAGTATHWRTSSGDADPNPEFVDILTTDFDMISPWTVGRYANEDDANGFAEEHIRGDMQFLIAKHDAGGKKVDYMPVVLPGGSGCNMTDGELGFNDIK